MAGETAVETPQDNTKIDEPVKTDKEAIVEEEKAAEQATQEEKKDEEKKEEEPKKEAVKPKKPTDVKDWEKDMVYLLPLPFTRSPRTRPFLWFVSSLSLGWSFTGFNTKISITIASSGQERGCFPLWR